MTAADVEVKASPLPLPLPGSAAGALYSGPVVHARTGPRAHRLRYRIFSMLVDIDRIDDLAAGSRWFSHNAFNLFSFHDADHGAALSPGSRGATRPAVTPRRAWPNLRGRVTALLSAAGCEIGGGRIDLLCMPRVLGYVFNPLSVYFCRRADGRLMALVYEVNNTFGQRHTYVIPVSADGDAAKDTDVIEQTCPKRFHVSPFLGMNMLYRFRVKPPGRSLSIRIDATPDGATTSADTVSLSASYAAERAPFDDKTLLRFFFTHPLLTLKVIGGIHWEALHIWRKGARFHGCPPVSEDVSIVGLDGKLTGMTDNPLRPEPAA